MLALNLFSQLQYVVLCCVMLYYVVLCCVVLRRFMMECDILRAVLCWAVWY